MHTPFALRIGALAIAVALITSRSADAHADGSTAPVVGEDVGPRSADGAGSPAPAQGDAEADAARDVDRMETTLSHATGHDRTLRTVAGWTLVGLGLAGTATGLYLSLAREGSDAAQLLLEDSYVLSLIGAGIVPSHGLDEVERYYEQDRATGRPPSLVRRDVEALWKHEADHERRVRRVTGWLFAVLGPISIGLSTFLLVDAGRPGPINASEAAWSASGIGMGAFWLAYGVYSIAAEGPVESALHAYERSTGRGAVLQGVTDLGPRVAAVPGGGVVGLGGAF